MLLKQRRIPQIRPSQVVVPIAVRIAEIELGQSCAFQLVAGASSMPHAHVMAVLVVTLKLLYGLDGQTRRLPEGLPPPPVWLEWAQEAIRRAPKPSLVRLLPGEVRSLQNVNHMDDVWYPSTQMHFSSRKDELGLICFCDKMLELGIEAEAKTEPLVVPLSKD